MDILSNIYNEAHDMFSSDLEKAVRELQKTVHEKDNQIRNKSSQYDELSALYENLNAKYNKVSKEWDSVFKIHPKLLETYDIKPLSIIGLSLGISTLAVWFLALRAGRINQQMAQRLAEGFELPVMGGLQRLTMADILRVEGRAARWAKIARVTKVIGSILVIVDVVFTLKSLHDQAEYLKKQKGDLEQALKEIDSNLNELNRDINEVIKGLVALANLFKEEGRQSIIIKNGTEEVDLSKVFQEDFLGIKERGEFEKFKNIMNAKVADLMAKIAKLSENLKVACKMLREKTEVSQVQKWVNIPAELVNKLADALKGNKINDCDKVQVSLEEKGELSIVKNTVQ